MNNLHIEFGDRDCVTLDFQLIDHPLTTKWIRKVLLAQSRWTIDDPKRFYGFESLEKSQQTAIDRINAVIDVIDSWRPIIKKRLVSINDQDTLNYLHNIFERYHGLLQSQDHEFWKEAPEQVRKALAELNIEVHRCESTLRGNQPRTVITYYGLPKKEVLESHEYDLFENNWSFGTVHLCYVEIGKTLEDLSVDDDQYIGDDAFRPFTHYSADFVVRFFDSDPDYRAQMESQMWHYFDRHSEWFLQRGFKKYDPRLRIGILPVARLRFPAGDTKDSILDLLRPRQYVNRVYFS